MVFEESYEKVYKYEYENGFLRKILRLGEFAEYDQKLSDTHPTCGKTYRDCKCVFLTKIRTSLGNCFGFCHPSLNCNCRASIKSDTFICNCNPAFRSYCYCFVNTLELHARRFS
jgi:hypothetical protein